MDEHTPEDPRANGVSVEEMEATVQAPTPEVERTLFRGGILSALGHRDFRILWSGALLSNIGTWIHVTVLLWFVKDLTGSNTWVGAVNMANYLPVLLFVLYAGSLADRLDRKKLIILTQAGLMAGALALAVTVDLKVDSIAVIMMITGLMGIAFVFTFPAWQAILPDLVPKEDLLNGIALNSAQFNMARFIGPGIGAMVLSAFGAETAFYVNAASFLAVIGALLLVRTKTPASPVPPEGTRKHIMEGLRYVAGNRWATNLLLVLGITSFFGLPYIVLAPSVAQDVLGKGAAGYGWLLVLSGFGAVLGAPLVTLLDRFIDERKIIVISVLSFGAFMSIYSLSRTFWLSLLISVGLGASFLVLGSAINTVLQMRVERDIRGRIMSFYVLMLLGVFPLGGQVFGVLADLMGTPIALATGGLVLLMLGMVLTAVPQITRGAVSVLPPEAIEA